MIWVNPISKKQCSKIYMFPLEGWVFKVPLEHKSGLKPNTCMHISYVVSTMGNVAGLS